MTQGCHNCTDIDGDVQFCKWLGGMYTDEILTVWFTAEASGNE